MPIIKSILDTDLYKLTMQQAVLRLYPDAVVEYRFKNRGKQKFSENFLSALKKEINHMATLSCTDEERKFLLTLPYLGGWYVDFLHSYRFDPNEVKVSLVDGDLDITINGSWYRTILWEVPLMAIISELYFQIDDTKWNYNDQEKKLGIKTSKLMAAQCSYFDFGTRRRRSFEVQDMIVKKMANHHWFGGTSNPYLAMKYNCKVVGTMAHEWIQGISALESMNHPNRFMLEKWTEVYGTELGVALTDTFGTKSFLKDFDKKFASMFAAVRHDSSDPFIFADKIVNHYKNLNINFKNKTIVFSDSLNADKAANIKKYCDVLGINSAFGIGTSFTNDFDTPALNMVIKLWSVNGTHVVKISDEPDKTNGEVSAVKFMKYLHIER